MKSALPALPLIVITLAMGLLGLAGWYLVAPSTFGDAVSVPLSSAQSHETSTGVIEPAAYPGVESSTATLLAGSPFVFDRSAYSREAPRRPEPPRPTYRPELVGMTGRSETRAALIVWNPGQPAERFRVGDDTHWGELVELSETEVVFEKDGELRRLGLFD